MAKEKITVALWNVLGPMGGKDGIMKEDDLKTEAKIQKLIQEEDPDFAFLQEVPELQWMPGLKKENFSEQISSRGKNYCRGVMFYRKGKISSCDIVPGNAEYPNAAGYIFKEEDGTELFRFLGIWNAPIPKSSSQSVYFENFKHILEHFQEFCHGAKNLVIAGDTNLILSADAYRDDRAKQKSCIRMTEDVENLMKELKLPGICPVANGADTLRFKGNQEWYRCDLLFVSDSLKEGLTTRLGSRECYVDKLDSDHLPIFAEIYV